MQIGEVGVMLQTMKNIEIKVNEAAGVAVLVELRMRLIGELFEPVQDELGKVIQKAQDKGRKIKHKKYWNCDLEFLEDAILSVFSKELEASEIKQLKEFRKQRNKLLHADFISLMEKLDIEPTGREIIGPSGKRNRLDKMNIQEAIKSIDRNQGFGEFRSQANEVIPILDRLIRLTPVWDKVIKQNQIYL